MAFDWFLKNKKGQISIEFVLILLIGIVYLEVVQTVLVAPSINSAKDVSRIGEARLAAEKISSAANELIASNGDAKQTIHVFVPESTTIQCDAVLKTISFSVQTESNLGSETSANCNDSSYVCTGTISIPTTNSISCTGFPLGGNSAKALYDVSISNISNAIAVNATVS